jgi:hypothetical protein
MDAFFTCSEIEHLPQDQDLRSMIHMPGLIATGLNADLRN